MKKAPIALALLFWAKPASAQAVPESCVVTEKATGRSDTLRPGTEVRVKVATSSYFVGSLIFWHDDTLALGPAVNPKAVLPVRSIQSVRWQLPDRSGARQRRVAGNVAMAAGMLLLVTGAIVDLNDNGLYRFEDDPTNPRGGIISTMGGFVTITGIIVSISGRKRSRTAIDPATGWLVSPLRQGR